jgi:hypothetical protein
MTDREIAIALQTVAGLERAVRQHLAQNPEPGEVDAALLVARQAGCLTKPLEKWIATRACLAVSPQQQTTA